MPHYTISAMFSLFHYLFVKSLLYSRLRLFLHLLLTSLNYLFKVSIVSLYVCYVTTLFEDSTVLSSVSFTTILSLRCFPCFIFCLLRHSCVLGFDFLFLCFVTSVYYLFQGFFCFIIFCYVSALF